MIFVVFVMVLSFLLICVINDKYIKYIYINNIFNNDDYNDYYGNYGNGLGGYNYGYGF